MGALGVRHSKIITSVGILTENIRQLVNTVEGNGTGILDLANVFIQEKQTADDDSDAATTLKLEKEKIFTSILENGNGDVDKDLRVYFWQEQDDLRSIGVRHSKIFINFINFI